MAALGIVVAWAGLAIAMGGGGGGGACPMPPRGWRVEPDDSLYAWLIVPPLVTFFVGMYLALGVKHRGRRVLAVLFVLGLTFCAFWIGALTVPFSCGHWVAP